MNDYEHAKHLCWEERYGGDEYIWTDIREKEVSRVKAIGYQMSEYPTVSKDLAQRLQEFTRILRRRLAREYRELLDQSGFAIVSHLVEDISCGHHTIWLARLR